MQWIKGKLDRLKVIKCLEYLLFLISLILKSSACQESKNVL